MGLWTEVEASVAIATCDDGAAGALWNAVRANVEVVTRTLTLFVMIRSRCLLLLSGVDEERR